jgi:hypothetical protein
MAKKLVSEIQALAGKEGWNAMSDELKKAIGSVPPPLEAKAIDLINSEIKAKNGKVDLWGIIENLGSAQIPEQAQNIAGPAPKPTTNPKPEAAKPNQPKESAVNRAKNTVNNIRQNKWVKRTVIGAGVIFAILVIIFIFWFIGGSSPETTSTERIQGQQENPQPAQQQSQTESVPTFQPEQTVDYKSVPFVGSILILILEGLLLIPLFGILDGTERLQMGDTITSLVGVLVNYFVTWAPMIAFLTAFKALSNPVTAMFVVTILTLAIVLMRAMTGGRDTTNIGVFFGFLALAGATSGSMGAMQIAFDVPSQPVYLLQDLPSAILSKQTPLIQYSMLVYSMFAISIVAYAIDIFFPDDKDTRWEALIVATIVIAGFYLVSIKLESYYSLLISVAFASLIATLARRRGKGLTTGENPLSNAISRVFEFSACYGVSIGIMVCFTALTSRRRELIAALINRFTGPRCSARWTRQRPLLQ